MLPVVQLASVAGVYGLSALVALVGTAAAVVALTQRPRASARRVAVGAARRAWWPAAGMVRVARGSAHRGGRRLRVGLVQGNVEQAQKWDPAFRDAIVDALHRVSAGR